MIFGLVAMAFTVVGGSIFRFTHGSTKWFHVLLRVVARILVVLGFFMMGTLVFEHLSGWQLGQQRAWLRAPSFYLAATFLLASAIWWARRQRLALRSGKGVISFLGYPVLVIALVIGRYSFASYMQRSQGQSLIAALRATNNQAAPEMEFVDADGRKHALSEFRGKVVLLNFWATTCGPCVQEMPSLSELQRRLRDRGLVLVYLSSEEPDVLARFFSTHSLEGLNGRLIPALPVPAFYQSGKAWPISFLINRDGVVKATFLGSIPPWEEKEIEKEL